MNHYHKKNGRFARKARNWTLGIVALSAIVFIPGRIAFNAYYGHEVSFKATAEAAIDGTALAQEIMDKKITGLQDEVIHDLEKCEDPSGNEALIHYDNNSHGTLTGQNIPSLGILEFKIGTIEVYENQLNGKKFNDKDAIELALDKTQAEAFAKDIIFRTKGGLWNWSCATPDMGLKVGLIKELMK